MTITRYGLIGSGMRARMYTPGVTGHHASDAKMFVRAPRAGADAVFGNASLLSGQSVRVKDLDLGIDLAKHGQRISA